MRDMHHATPVKEGWPLSTVISLCSGGSVGPKQDQSDFFLGWICGNWGESTSFLLDDAKLDLVSLGLLEFLSQPR